MIQCCWNRGTGERLAFGGYTVFELIIYSSCCLVTESCLEISRKACMQGKKKKQRKLDEMRKRAEIRVGVFVFYLVLSVDSPSSDL